MVLLGQNAGTALINGDIEMSKTYLDLSAVGMRSKPKKALKRQVANLKIAKGEFISLIGHPAAGRAPLNLVAGLTEATSGGIISDGREVDGPGPESVPSCSKTTHCCPVLSGLSERRTGCASGHEKRQQKRG